MFYTVLERIDECVSSEEEASLQHFRFQRITLHPYRLDVLVGLVVPSYNLFLGVEQFRVDTTVEGDKTSFPVDDYIEFQRCQSVLFTDFCGPAYKCDSHFTSILC